MAEEKQGEFTDVEKAIITLNREMGEVLGRLDVLVWLFRGSLFVMVAQWVTSFFI